MSIISTKSSLCASLVANISIENTLQGRKIVEIMENCVKLSVPLLVDMEVGPSWGEIKEIKK